MTIRKLTAADEPIFYEMCEEFFHSSAVCHPIPMAHHIATFQELLQADTYLFGYLMEVDGEPAGFAILNQMMQQEAGGIIIWYGRHFVRRESADNFCSLLQRNGKEKQNNCGWK